MVKFKHYLFALLLMLVFSITAKVLAQIEKTQFEDKAKNQQNTSKEKPVENNIIDTDQLIHFGDLIDVDVLGSTEYDWRGTITPEGFLDGIEFTDDSIYGLCQSETQIAEDIKNSYGKILNDPKIIVSILDRSNRPLTTLYGAVKKPQRFNLKRKIHLNELIILSGGFTEKANGDIQILRQFETSCFEKLTRETILDESKIGDDKDIVNVRPDNSSKFINIKVSDLLSGKLEANPQILYGDVITVLNAEPIYVIGGVANPTKITVREEITVSRAIASAGGLTKQANQQNITIFRRENGQTKLMKINLDDIEAKKSDDVILKAYDIVDVAEKNRDETKYPPIIRFEDIQEKQNSDLPIRIID